MYQLRPYQLQAIDKLAEAFRSGRRAPVLVAPTGAGKTVIASHIINQTRQACATLFLAHRRELIAQCSLKLNECGIRHGIIKAGMDRGRHNERVQVASVQTFQRRINNMRRDFGTIIIDEGHHAVADTYRQVFAHCYPQHVRIGLTATPYRTDGASLSDVFDALVSVCDVGYLVDNGFLVPLRTFRAAFQPQLTRVRSGADYNTADLAEAMDKPRLIGHALREYLRLARGRKGLGFCVNKQHARDCAQEFNNAGVRSAYLTDDTPQGKRKETIDALARGRIQLIFNCGVLTEGFDDPTISVILALRPTQSRCLWRQMVGRGLRISPETYKVDCLLLDHARWTETHGRITDPDHVDLHGGLQKEPQAEEKEPTSAPCCKACGAGIPEPRPPRCPDCGQPYPGQIHPGLGDERYSLEEDADLFNIRPNPAVFQARKKEPAPARPPRRTRVFRGRKVS